MTMIRFKCCVTIFTGLVTLQLCSTFRRITNGQEVKDVKPFMVYMVRALTAKVQYDAWICGGAIVTSRFIITSAACVEDVQHMYAIAGTSRYVQYAAMETDECAKVSRKKVVQTCVPKVYNFTYEDIERWSNIDIAVAEVESPYHLDKPFGGSCDYAPKKIRINLSVKWQKPGTDALVLGWGHENLWRKPDDPKDYNQPTLRYASTAILDKEVCKRQYKNVSALMPAIIEKYMICADGVGAIDDDGSLVHSSDGDIEGCTSNNTLRSTFCNKYQQKQKQNSPKTRKNGICQNDHGGPLISWIGSHQVLLGVASVFRITDQSECTGPYLYTSTACNSAFLNCILQINPDLVKPKNGNRVMKSHYKDSRLEFDPSMCRQPPALRGFDMVQTRISWIKHPDGPAENEIKQQHESKTAKLKIRPQISLHKFT